MRCGAGRCRWSTAPRASGPRVPARVLLALLVLEIVVFTVVDGSRGPQPAGFDPLIDGWLQGAGYVTAAALAAPPAADVVGATARSGRGSPRRSRPARSASCCSSPSSGGRSRCPTRLSPTPRGCRCTCRCWSDWSAWPGCGRAGCRRPSCSTAPWARWRPRPSRSRCCTRPSCRSPHPGRPRRSSWSTWPIRSLDLALLVVVIGLLVVFEWRAPPAVWALAAGIVGFAVIDCVFVYLSASGTFRPGTLLSSASLAVMALVAVAGWLPERTRTNRRDPLPNVVLPGLFALVCLGLLIFGTRETVPGLGIGLARCGCRRRDRPDRTVLPLGARRWPSTGGRPGPTSSPGWRTGAPSTRRSGGRPEPAPRRPRPRRPRGGPRRLQGRSTTPSATTTGTNSCGSWPHACGRRCAATTWWRGSGVTSSPSCCRVPTPPGRPRSPSGCGPASAVPSGWGPGPRRSRRASASRWRPRTVTSRSNCSSTPTWPCTRRRPTGPGRRGTGEAMHTSGRLRLETTERLRRAIRSGELVLHYQPQVSLRTGTVAGVEALVRWEHPEAGLVPPSGFLPQAESGGLMPMLTRAVLAKAVQQGAEWHAQGTAGDPRGQPLGDQPPRPAVPGPGDRPARGRAAAGRGAGTRAHRGPVHGRSRPGAHRRRGRCSTPGSPS